jgi:hypothetical protein
MQSRCRGSEVVSGLIVRKIVSVCAASMSMIICLLCVTHDPDTLLHQLYPFGGVLATADVRSECAR